MGHAKNRLSDDKGTTGSNKVIVLLCTLNNENLVQGKRIIRLYNVDHQRIRKVIGE